MFAMQATAPGQRLSPVSLPLPAPATGEVLIKVSVCGICRTDLHVLDGELPETRYPVVPGHQIVGRVVALGNGVQQLAIGQRVGVPWLGHSCGHCDYCRHQQENLCGDAVFTGCQRDGGFAEYCVADARFCLALPAACADTQVAPLLCAGLIGYRALKLAGPHQHIGFMGFGASAHLLCQLATAQGSRVYAFTRAGDTRAQQLALELGAVWAGGSDTRPPVELDAVIIFAAAGELVPLALQLVRRGGRVVCAGIHMSDIPSFPYRLLWGERTLCSVANLTRQDGIEFLDLAARTPLRTVVQEYPLAQANAALDDLRHGRFSGAAVLVVDDKQPHGSHS